MLALKDLLVIVNLLNFTTVQLLQVEVLSGPVGWQLWHLITDSHLCVGSTPTGDNAEDLSQYDPGC